MPTLARGLGFAVVSTLLLSACTAKTTPGTPDTRPLGCPDSVGPVAFVIGGRANTPAVSGTPTVNALTLAAAANESTVTLFDAGGQPASVGQFSLRMNGQNDPAREAEARNNATAVAKRILLVRATTPEANPLDALTQAADAVRSASEAGVGSIVMVDSGLQTTGLLDYTHDGLLSADPDDVVNALDANGQLPNLTGISVFLVGIGQTVAPQEPLDAGARHNLQAQWGALAEAGGAKCVKLDNAALPTTPTKTGLPKVTTVPVPEAVLDLPTPEQPLALKDEIRFKSNSAEYIDPQRARDRLAPIADWMTKTGTSVKLTGTTATDGTEAGRKELSLLRAEAVKSTLVELGVDSSTIKTFGVGTNHPSHVNDLGAHGELLPGPAAQNRLVIVSVDG